MNPEDPNFIDGIYKDTYSLDSVFGPPHPQGAGLTRTASFTVPVNAEDCKDRVRISFILDYDIGRSKSARLIVALFSKTFGVGSSAIDVASFDPTMTESVRLLIDAIQSTVKELRDSGPCNLRTAIIFSSFVRHCNYLAAAHNERLAEAAEVAHYLLGGPL